MPYRSFSSEFIKSLISSEAYGLSSIHKFKLQNRGGAHAVYADRGTDG